MSYENISRGLFICFIRKGNFILKNINYNLFEKEMEGDRVREIKTERLLLRKYQRKDYHTLKKLWLEYMKTHKKSDKEDLVLIDKWIFEFASKDFCWVAEDRERGKVIGNINIIKMSRKHRNCEVAYAVDIENRRRGYATEMLKAIIDYLLNEEDFHVIEAKHYSGNPNSGMVMKKAGMKKEAELIDRRFNFKTGCYENLICYYSISKC